MTRESFFIFSPYLGNRATLTINEITDADAAQDHTLVPGEWEYQWNNELEVGGFPTFEDAREAALHHARQRWREVKPAHGCRCGGDIIKVFAPENALWTRANHTNGIPLNAVAYAYVCRQCTAVLSVGFEIDH